MHFDALGRTAFRSPAIRAALSASALGMLLASAACGGGGSSSTSGTLTVAASTAPGAPLNVVATAGNGNATLTFSAPASTGGSAITSYSATCSAGASSVVGAGAASPITLSGLTNGLNYTCTVRSTNAIGTGDASAPVNVTPLATIGTPGAPTLQSLTAANTSALITFQAPASPGASAITSYTARCSSGATPAVTATGATSPILVLGLTNGAAYACVVSAANAVGAGPDSASLTVTPNPSSATPAGVASFTTIDFAALANYANPTLPAYYDGTVAALDNTPPGNPISDRTATLGRVLFYDKRLSINDAVSCASCHQQASGFTDPQRFSVGFNGAAFTTAHSMRLGNARYYRPGAMFWDKRTASLETQASEPIQNAVEMGWTAANGGMAALITKLDSTTYYRDLFNLAFGTPAITEARIQQAIAQFERAMVSTSSRWDSGYAIVFNPAAANRALDVDLPNFSTEENRGRLLFMNGRGQGGAGCAACHIPPTFALAANSQSNGLDAGETRIFKSPSLKGVGVTGPYMHDGRFATLEQVVDFYDRGVQVGPALDNRLRQGAGPLTLNLPATDRAALVAFLRTLDDGALNTDRKFSSPVIR